jgi:gamma-glutamyltranspeptidase/glutathione hydrolase/leukotriene-C4 hydrolase
VIFSDAPYFIFFSVSTQDKNGQAVAVTTTVNLYFGSKLRGRRTGITFNDGMDDFSTTGFNNDFGVPPSPMNFVKGGKRCVSSMAPTIAIDKLTGKAKVAMYNKYEF